MTERRTARRYDLSLPIIIRVPAERVPDSQQGKTRDISARGLYFVVDQNLESGSQLDITLTLPAEITHGSEVFVRALGKVVRVERRMEVFSITEETSVHQAAQYLREKQVRSVGVTDASGKLAGVISHSDISDKVAAENKCPAWMKASDIMTRELVTVTPEVTLEDCLRLMEQNTIFHLIVLDGQQGFLGMLSVSDILRVVASDEKARADLLESFIFPSR